jgi:hypothetical protein
MRGHILAGAALIIGSLGSAPSMRDPAPALLRFDMTSVRLEQNATDEDMEVVFEATAGEEGLASLAVVAPDGRTVISFTALPNSTPGIRQFRFESPEPKEGKGLKAAYPQGDYTFTGATAAGEKLQGVARLGYKLPATVSLVSPKPKARGVTLKDFGIEWKPADNVAGYIIEIEQAELKVSIEAKLPSTVTRFDVPEGFLRPGTQYHLGIGTLTKGGNASFVETTFTTEGKE